MNLGLMSLNRRTLGLTTLAILAALNLTGVACARFKAAPTPGCGMGDVAASGSPTKHTYSFTLDCNDIAGSGNVKGKVGASYDLNTGVAQESFKNEKGRFIAEWNCPRDPWIRAVGDNFTCTMTSKSANLSVPDSVLQNIYFAAGPRPYSAEVLTDFYRHTLDAQLQNDYKRQAPRPAPAPAPAPKPAPAPAPAPTTVSRTSADYVKWVQRALNQVDDAQIPVDGDFGPVTDQAVRNFQAGHGLFVDGVVGPITEAELVKAGAPKPPGTVRTGEAKLP